METKKYVRNPIVVEGVQVTQENLYEVAAWCQGDIISNGDDKHIRLRLERVQSERQTKAFIGDWVLSAPTGFKIYTNKAFEKSFSAHNPDLNPIKVPSPTS